MSDLGELYNSIISGVGETAGALGRGLQSAKRVTHPAAAALARLTGLPEGGETTDELIQYFLDKEKELTAGREPEDNTTRTKVVRAIGGAVPASARAVASTLAFGSPTVGMASEGALMGGPRAGAENAAAVQASHLASRFLPPAARPLVDAAVSGGITAAEGGDLGDIAAAAAGTHAANTAFALTSRGRNLGRLPVERTGELSLRGPAPEQPAEPKPPASEPKPVYHAPTKRSVKLQGVHDLAGELAGGDYVILTGTQEAAGPHHAEANVQANESLYRDLRGEGYDPLVMKNNMWEGVEQGPSFHVPDMTLEEGVKYAKKYGQNSIIVARKGVAGIYDVNDGTWSPIDLSKTVMGPAALEQPGYSVYDVGNERVPMFLNVDFNKKAPFTGFPAEKGASKGPQGNPSVQSGASEYMKQLGIPEEKVPQEYLKQPESMLADIADNYESSIHDAGHPAIEKSYQEFNAENVAQFEFAMNKMGMKFEPWRGEGQPYNNSAEMMTDVAKNHHLFFFTGGEMPADHPMSQPSPIEGLTYNDVFRAVHDLFGHAKGGFQFGPRGEFNAFLAHYQMYTPAARSIALVNETLGQNSWVNYGKHIREQLFPPALAERPFAEQKATALNPSVVNPALEAGGRQPVMSPEEIARMPRPLPAERAAYGAEDLFPETAEPTVPEVAKKFQKITRETYGQPKAESRRTAALVKLLREEVPQAIEKFPESQHWYSKKVTGAIEEMSKVFPSIAKEGDRQRLFKTMLAISSNGTDPRDNLAITRRAFGYYENGPGSDEGKNVIPQMNPETGRTWGRPDIGNHFGVLNKIIYEKGEGGAIEWLLSKHPQEELYKYGSEKSLNKYLIPDENGEAYGSAVFGPKIGAFIGALNGNHQVVVDRWLWRTAGRAWGDLVTLDKNGELAFRSLGNAKQNWRSVRDAVNQVAKELGLQPEEVQALQWYYEKGLYEKHGAAEPAQDYETEARELVKKENERKAGKKNNRAP